MQPHKKVSRYCFVRSRVYNHVVVPLRVAHAMLTARSHKLGLQIRLTFSMACATLRSVDQNVLVVSTNLANAGSKTSFPSHVLPPKALSSAGHKQAALAASISLLIDATANVASAIDLAAVCLMAH